MKTKQNGKPVYALLNLRNEKRNHVSVVRIMNLYVGPGTLLNSLKMLNGVNYNNFEKLQVNAAYRFVMKLSVDEA